VVCNHHTNQDTAGAFHIFNGGLMSDVTMCQLLSVTDLGHIMSLSISAVSKKFGRFHPKLSQTQVVCSHHTNQDTAGAFHILNGGLMSDQLLSVPFCLYAASQKFGRFHPQLSQTQVVCCHHTNQDTAGAFHILNGGLMSDVTMCQLLSVTDLGHIMSLSISAVSKKFGRFHPKPSQSPAGGLQSPHQSGYCWSNSNP
jgi:hypothetical protein